MVDPVNPSGIIGNYPGRCRRLNSGTFIISYRAGDATRPIKPLSPPTRSLWMEPIFVFSLKWASWITCYVGTSSTLVRKGIGK